ncbi:hypothetical protein LCGC14_1259850 [marine sediment metagenome]|uniref:Uncharacterized protein n=1 Tax=marine sediment metagenome TaxID=412755 RepID=A0A0F9P4F3_9ZZZZ
MTKRKIENSEFESIKKLVIEDIRNNPNKRKLINLDDLDDDKIVKRQCMENSTENMDHNKEYTDYSKMDHEEYLTNLFRLEMKTFLQIDIDNEVSRKFLHLVRYNLEIARYWTAKYINNGLLNIVTEKFDSLRLKDSGILPSKK